MPVSFFSSCRAGQPERGTTSKTKSRCDTTACRKSARAASICTKARPTRLRARPKSEPGKGDDKQIELSQLVDKLNERFGTDFKQADQLFFDQIAEDAVGNETLRTAAEVNSLENFRHVFERMLEGLFIDRMDGNEEIFDRIMKDPQFRNIASDHLMREVYERLQNAATGASSVRQAV